MPRIPRKPSEVPRGLFNTVFSWILKQRVGQIEQFMKHPHGVQRLTYRRLISDAQDTEWGQKYRYNEIGSVNEFRERVPISDYEDLQPWIERLMQGEQNLLWPTPIKWFAKSSGTTAARSKFIPVSNEALEECHFKGGKDLMTLYCHNVPDTGVFSGRGLVMGGSHQVNQLAEGSFYGDVSAVMMQNMPMAARFIRTPDLSIALMDDWEEKIEKMAEATLKQNVTHIAGVPTWTIVLIRRLFEKTGVENIREIWPNLELYIHGGVSFEPYRDTFKELIRGEGMHYIETYNASEGFFALQDTLDEHDLLLMLDYGIFYEFIPMEDFDSDQPKTVLLDEVEVGKNYAVVISTNAGLWRYRIGDTVRFTSIDPYRIRVSGRVKHFINAFGEELIVENADKALAMTCAELGAEIREYTAAPVYFEGDKKGGHEWIIEFSEEPADLSLWKQKLDLNIRSLNSDYDAKRQMAIDELSLQTAPQGTFYKWLKFKGKLGGQHKIPRLSNNREILEEIKEIAAL